MVDNTGEAFDSAYLSKKSALLFCVSQGSRFGVQTQTTNFELFWKMTSFSNLLTIHLKPVSKIVVSIIVINGQFFNYF